MMKFPDPPRVHVIWVPGADPDRDAIVEQLRAEADVCLHMDPDRNGCIWNWLTAIECAAKNDTDIPWSVILSDDAEPLPGWQTHLAAACMASPQPFLGLTHFGGYGLGPLSKGAAYGVSQALLWGGAIAYHRSIVPGLARWARAVHDRTGYPHDDFLVVAYALRNGLKCALTSRAIFGQPVKKSLLNHNTPIRTPATTIENTPVGPPWLRSSWAHVSKQVHPDIKALAKENA